jgi:hypothetical protein
LRGLKAIVAALAGFGKRRSVILKKGERNARLFGPFA